MKAVCLALLLVLTLNLQFTEHAVSSPLATRNFLISSNSANNNAINGIEVSFTSNQVSFKGCNKNIAPYITVGNKFHVFSFEKTKIACGQDNDRLVQAFFTNSKTYTLNGKDLTLKDEAGNVTLTLKQK